MTTRFRAGDPRGVPSGYEGVPTTDYRVPSCGVEDVDRALFRTLRDEVVFQVSDNGGGNQRAVPMVFAVGEKWSMLKSGRALRDKDGTLILPMVTIRRVSVEQSVSDVAGRGTNQHVGEFIVKTRLHPRDRAYQNLVNKLGLPNADDVPGERDYSEEGTVTTLRPIGENVTDLDVRDGALLAPKLGKNVWQIVTIPTPQYFTAIYEMTLWAQYTDHMNQMLEKLMSSYLPTGHRSLRLDTLKGYWFVAYFDENYTMDDNSSDSTGVELMRRCKLTLKVPAYVVASDTPGLPQATRAYVSAPTIAFALGGERVDTTLTEGSPSKSDPYEGADDPARFLLLDDPSRHPAARVGTTSERIVSETIVNPFTGRREARFVRVTQRNVATGESVLLPDDGLNIKIVSPK